jgi:SHOCT-like protein
MNENRLKILQMLSTGQISADEAERLIAALEKEPPASPPPAGFESNPKAKPKYLRVVVEPEKEGQVGPKVNIRVPVQLLRAGVKLGSLIPDQARIHVNEALHGHGLQFDLTQIKPENIEELIDHLKDLTVDVDDKDIKVRVFCE